MCTTRAKFRDDVIDYALVMPLSLGGAPPEVNPFSNDFIELLISTFLDAGGVASVTTLRFPRGHGPSRARLPRKVLATKTVSINMAK